MRRKFHLGHIRSWRDCSVKSCSSIHSIVFECRSTVPPFHRSPRSFEPCPVAFPVSGADIGRIFHRKAMIVMKKCRSCQKRRPEKSMSIPSCFTEQPFAQGVPSSAMGFGWRINPRAPSLPMREFNPISMRQWLPAATTTLLKKEVAKRFARMVSRHCGDRPALVRTIGVMNHFAIEEDPDAGTSCLRTKTFLPAMSLAPRVVPPKVMLVFSKGKWRPMATAFRWKRPAIC